MRLFTTLSKALLFAAFVISAGQTLHAQSKSLPYKTGFNNSTEQNDWTMYQLGSKAYGNFGYAKYNSNSYFLYRDYPVGNTSDQVEDWVVSPAINITGKSLISLQSKLFVFGGLQPSDYFGIWYSTKTGDPAKGDFKELVNMTNHASRDTAWRDTANILLNDSGAAVYIAFKYKQTDNWYTVSIDNFMVKSVHTTGIDVPSENHVSVYTYPNPATGSIHFTLGNMEPGNNARLDIMDMGGRLCRSISGIKSDDPQEISLPAGLYTYRLVDKNGQATSGRFIMQ
jgi:hypothetical protein